MRRARTTAAACVTLILLICAWILLALSAPSMATSSPRSVDTMQRQIAARP